MADQVRLDKVGDLITALTTEHVTAFMSEDGESGHATVMKIIEAVLTYLGAPVVLEGYWDASEGTFPGGGEAKKGWSYIVTTAGTVDGVEFNVNDRLIAKANNASATTYEDNWFKADYTDQVLSVAGLTGAISATALAAALTTLMPKAGGKFSGPINVANYVTSSAYYFVSGSFNRWNFAINGSETGDNVGSDLKLFRYADDGLWLGNLLTFYRATGGLMFGSATGGDPGAGKINAEDYLINGDSVADALAARVLSSALAAVATSGSYNDLIDKPAAVSGAPDAVIEDQKASGTDGGTFTAGAWQTRDLNTEVRDPDGVIALSSYQLTPSVDGWVEWSAPAYKTTFHASRLYNVTDGVVAAGGTSEAGGADSYTTSRSIGGCAVVAGKTYRLEHRCGVTASTNGLGKAAGFGGAEIYSRIEFWRA
jgi:hypothetical protein